jgi:hypothetical protein
MTWIADVQIANVHGSDRSNEEDVEEAHQEDHPAEHHALWLVNWSATSDLLANKSSSYFCDKRVVHYAVEWLKIRVFFPIQDRKKGS